MKHEQSGQFKSTPGAKTGPSMMQAIAAARTGVAELTAQTFDSISQCVQQDDGTWLVSIDMIESLARMGDNDLLATYDLQIGQDQKLVSFNRRRRYHREDQEG